jgi:hypothetical protein
MWTMRASGSTSLDRLHGRDVGRAEGEAEGEAVLPGVPEGGGPAPLAAHEAEEGDLVDRGEEVGTADPGHDELRRRPSVGGEAPDEPGVERVGVVGKAVVAEIPDREDLVAIHGRDERLERGEVVAAAAVVDERPGDPLAGDGDAEAPEEGVVLVGVLGVARLLDQVPPALVRQSKVEHSKPDRKNVGKMPSCSATACPPPSRARLYPTRGFLGP